MIRSLPNPRSYTLAFKVYIILYFVFLFAPLFITCVLAFNDSQFPSLPWKGFSLDWFMDAGPVRVGIFHDPINPDSIYVSFQVAFFVTLLSTAVGTPGAFLFEQEDFRFKQVLYFLMLAPLPINLYLQVRDGSTPVINAVSFLMITGTSLLAFVNLYFSNRSSRP